MKNKKANRFTFDSRIDYGLILPAFMLILIGLYALYVAVSHDHPTQATNLVVQQGTWVIVGLFVALIVMHMDSRFLWNLTPFFYLLGLILMVLPIFFYDKATYASTGAKKLARFWRTKSFSTVGVYETFLYFIFG